MLNWLPAYLPVCLVSYPTATLPAYLPAWLFAYLTSYLPAYLSACMAEFPFTKLPAKKKTACLVACLPSKLPGFWLI
jgi:hypothetical protein